MIGAVKAVGGAVIGTMPAVTRGRDPSEPVLTVTSTVPAVTAVAGRPSLCLRAGGPGHFCSRRWSRSLTKRSLARPKLRLFCAARVATPA